MKVAIYPGTFDPITKGHLDIIKRSCKFVDKLIIAVSENDKKKTLFSISERMEMIKSVIQDEGLLNIDVDSFNDLLMNYANKKKATIIIRGLRAISDFEYEFQMTGMNYKLNPKIETVFLMSSDKYQLISSKLIREINSLKGDVSQFVPKIVENKLKKKNKN
jgi:pantetheine-phosphate adenylyltransferase